MMQRIWCLILNHWWDFNVGGRSVKTCVRCGLKEWER